MPRKAYARRLITAGLFRMMALSLAGVAIPLVAFGASLDVRADACVTPDGGSGIGCVSDLSVPIATKSATSSGTNSSSVPFTSSASAFTDASNLGILRISGTSSITGGAQANAVSQINIDDILTLSDGVLPGGAAVPNGTPGVITVPVLVRGSTSTENNVVNAFDGQARAFWNYVVTVDGVTEVLHLVADFTQLDVDSFLVANFVNGVPGDPYGLASLEIPFTWGDPFSLQIQFVGFAINVGTPSFASASSAYSLAESVYWGGFASVLAGGVPVSSFDFTSESGFDWRSSSIPQSAVPNPGPLALVGFGLVVLVPVRVALAKRHTRRGKSARCW